MDRLATMRTFISVAETGSFSETARLLDVSAPLVSRHISDLEAHLGIRLFNRTTRRVDLSEAGAAYYPDCVALIEQLDAAEALNVGAMAALASVIEEYELPAHTVGQNVSRPCSATWITRTEP